MKKTFNLVHPKIKAPRIVDSIKHDIKKYLKKERDQVLPSGMKYLTFDCFVGQSETSANKVDIKELNATIDDLVLNKAKTIYIEISAVAVASLN